MRVVPHIAMRTDTVDIPRGEYASLGAGAEKRLRKQEKSKGFIPRSRAVLWYDRKTLRR